MIWLVWVLFILFVVALLALDLGVFHRKAHVVSVREALGWSVIWITLGLAFSIFIYFAYSGHWFGLGMHPDAVDGRINTGHSAMVKYLTGYVVEESLSVDNIFVMGVIFSYFAIPQIYQHRVLFWGILGAQVMRGIMIALGAAVIGRFSWVLYLFGAFLIFTAIRMLLAKDSEESSDPDRNWVLRLVRRWIPITRGFHDQHLAVRAGGPWSHAAALPGQEERPDPAVDAARKGMWMLTPLGVALILVETTDLIFAVDSIPAIFAITADPFLVYTSNVFAILGLRSMYFALAGALKSMRYLKVSLAIVLSVVGIKMLLGHWLEHLFGDYVDLYMLCLVVGILGCGVGASMTANWKERART